MEIRIKELTCNRCGYKWFPRTPKTPKACPGCKTHLWNMERVKNISKENMARRRD